MTLRLTPLNILSSVLLVSIAYLLANADESGWRELGIIPLLVMFLLCTVSDLIFRRLIPGIKRIWLFEILFLIFVTVFILLIRKFIL